MRRDEKETGVKEREIKKETDRREGKRDEK